MAPSKLLWVASSGGEHPKDSIRAGIDDGEKVYVARAMHEGNVIPGKLHNTHSSVYIPYDSQEVAKEEYEVLTGPPAALSWVESSDGNVPAGAVEGGYDSGETMYIGRVIHEGSVTVGKVHPSHGCCYISYGGEELSFKEYEILVRNKLGQFLGV